MPELGLMTAPWTSFPRRICEIPALVLQPGEEEEAPVSDWFSEGEWEEVAIWRGNSFQVSTMYVLSNMIRYLMVSKTFSVFTIRIFN